MYTIFGKKQKRSVENEPVVEKAVNPAVHTSLAKRSNVIDVYSNNQAIKLAAVYRCIEILSGTIASIPLEIKRKTGGYFSVDEKNELYPLLSRMPNKRMNNFELMRNAIVQMKNNGNAYIVIQRKFSNLSALVLCANNTVVYDKLNDIYTISDPYNRIYGRFESYQIIHLKNNSLDGGYTGEGTIACASRSFSIAASIDNQSLDIFQNGSKIKGLVTGAKNTLSGISGLSNTQLSTVSDSIEDQLNSGKDIVAIPEEATLTQLSINPVDSQLAELKDASILDVCRFFGVHPDKVFVGQSTNYKASEMSNVSFLTDTLQPILRQIECEFNAKLIPDSLASVYKISFDLNYLYQTDLTTQIAYNKGRIESGLATPNEIRLEMGLKPIEGGDTTFISCNLAPINSPKISGETGEIKENKIVEPPKTGDKNI